MPDIVHGTWPGKDGRSVWKAHFGKCKGSRTHDQELGKANQCSWQPSMPQQWGGLLALLGGADVAGDSDATLQHSKTGL